jgi:abortive infection bacteriophage resistance protein
VEAHRDLLSKIRYEARKSKDDFVVHYFDKYTSEVDLPLWMACELMTFGSLLTLFTGVSTRMKKDVAHHYCVPVPVLGSWLKALNRIRNACAHHARLWNRQFGVCAVVPEKETDPAWHEPVKVEGDRLFTILTILHYLLRQVAPKSRWKDRLVALFAQHPAVPLRFMGFPENWQACPLWTSAPVTAMKGADA